MGALHLLARPTQKERAETIGTPSNDRGLRCLHPARLRWGAAVRETATVGDRDAFGDALRRTDGRNSAAVSRGVEPATCKYERSRGVNQLLICVVTKHGYALHDLTHENRNL